MQYLRSLLSAIDLLLFPYEYFEMEVPIQMPFTSDQIMNVIEAPKFESVRMIRRHRVTGIYQGYMSAFCAPEKKDPFATKVGYDWFVLPTDIQESMEARLQQELA